MTTYVLPPTFREIFALYRLHGDVSSAVKKSLGEFDELIEQIEAFSDRNIRDLDVLEIGPGQRAAHRHMLSSRNRYTGIDIEV